MSFTEERLFTAAQRIVALQSASIYPASDPVDTLSPIAELAVEPHYFALVQRAAMIARVLVDGRPPDVPQMDRSIARAFEVPCSPPERCFLGAEHTSLGWEPAFIRIHPKDRLTSMQRERLKLWGVALTPHLARPRRIEARGEELVVLFDRASGASLDQLAPLIPPLALALLAEARLGLAALHSLGMTHGALSPKRVRISPNGRPVLCYGLEGAFVDAFEDQAALARIILSTAFDDPLLFEILAGADDGACIVACDRIIELEPRLDDLAVAALRPEERLDLIAPALARLGVREAAASMIAIAMEESQNDKQASLLG